MLDNITRPLKEIILLPFARFTGKLLSPNQISVIAFLVGCGSVWAITENRLILGVSLWGANRILDGLDGTVARVTDRKSDFGGYLDLMLDLILYAAIPIAFVYRDAVLGHVGPGLIWSCLVLLGVFYVNLGSWALLSALIEKQKGAIEAKKTKTGTSSEKPGEPLTSLEMPRGAIEGTETVVLFTLFYLLPGVLSWLFWGMAALTFLGVIQRLIWGHRYLK